MCDREWPNVDPRALHRNLLRCPYAGCLVLNIDKHRHELWHEEHPTAA